MVWREIPPRWWAIVLGVIFGSMALISISAEKQGHRKAIVGAILTAPLLSLIAGGLLPKNVSLELAALVGGLVALGGTTLILGLSRIIPPLIIAGVSGAARSFLAVHGSKEGEMPEVDRINPDGTPASPDFEAEKLVEEIDRKSGG